MGRPYKGTTSEDDPTSPHYTSPLSVGCTDVSQEGDLSLSGVGPDDPQSIPRVRCVEQEKKH